MKKLALLIFVSALLCLQGCDPPDNPFFVPQVTVEEFLNDMVDIMEANHINRQSIDWTEFRNAVLQEGSEAETIPEAKSAITLALEKLGDGTSFVLTSSNEFLSITTTCSDAEPPAPAGTSDIGYIKIEPVSSLGVDAAIYAEIMHGEIRDQDRSDLKGWIVDLRQNTGGNMWPMLAGIGPILGEGTAGYFVDSNGVQSSFGYVIGSSVFDGGTVVTVSFPYTLVSPDAKVAVLLDHATTNSAEVVAIAFSGKENTRSFGATTCGIGRGNKSYTLADGFSLLYLTTSFPLDRNEVNKTGPVQPDEIISDPTMIFDRAVEWINEPG